MHKEHPRGTGNVLADLGFDDAEELSVKTVLAVKLNELMQALVSLDQHVEIVVRRVW